MNGLQARIYAKRRFNLAIEKNMLADFAIGLGPYAEQKTDGGEFPTPVLVPNMEFLYDYHEDNPSAHLDTDVQKAVIRVVEEKGDDAYVVLHALVFVMTHLAYEQRGAAKFALDCPGILRVIKGKLKKYKDVPEQIEYYSRLLRERYNMPAVCD